MQPLYESWRPRQWSDVVGQDKALARLDTLRRRGLESKIYWITGQSGTGKTTIARLIAEDVADPCIIEEMDGANRQCSTNWYCPECEGHHFPLDNEGDSVDDCAEPHNVHVEITASELDGTPVVQIDTPDGRFGGDPLAGVRPRVGPGVFDLSVGFLATVTGM